MDNQDSLERAKILKYYSRRDVRREIIANAESKEIAVKYGESGFGKRPDVLTYEQDVYEFAKQGATSFHASEELWQNPLNLTTSMRRIEQDELRTGWDLVLDIDCKEREYSAIAADLIIKALKYHGIENISCKFSGNKGMHIGVPFESFPRVINQKETRFMFPEAPRAIAMYIKQMILPHLAERLVQKDDINKIMQKTGKQFNEIVKDNKLDPFLLLDIDTILISSRHMYRMPYSLNEKSGLASIAINPDNVLDFDINTAKPENVKILLQHRFLDKTKSVENEGKRLLLQALDFEAKKQETKTAAQENKYASKKESERYQITAAMPEEKFPPCMKKAFLGLEDGKKRFLFLAINFLSSVGWNYEEIEKKMLEWNKKNKEPLRENYLLGQIRYAKSQNKKILPPNCANINYYQDLHICEPDELCKRIKNPVNYTIIRAKIQKENERKPKRKKAKDKKIRKK